MKIAEKPMPTAVSASTNGRRLGLRSTSVIPVSAEAEAGVAAIGRAPPGRTRTRTMTYEIR